MPNKPVKPVAVSNKQPVDVTELSKLATWLESTGLEEMEVETLEYRVRLKKPSMATMCPPAPMPQPVNLTVNPAPAAAAAPVDETANAFKSPMVGTFYHAAKPDAAPFVKEGDKVTAGQVVGIIEAMKTMNQIEADRAGTVTKVLVKNGQPVEFGQPLLVIA